MYIGIDIDRTRGQVIRLGYYINSLLITADRNHAAHIGFTRNPFVNVAIACMYGLPMSILTVSTENRPVC